MLAVYTGAGKIVSCSKDTYRIDVYMTKLMILKLIHSVHFLHFYFCMGEAVLSQLTACNMYGQGTLTLVSTKHQTGLRHIVKPEIQDLK